MEGPPTPANGSLTSCRRVEWKLRFEQAPLLRELVWQATNPTQIVRGTLSNAAVLLTIRSNCGVCPPCTS